MSSAAQQTLMDFSNGVIRNLNAKKTEHFIFQCHRFLEKASCR